jgi:hypothetical protein
MLNFTIQLATQAISEIGEIVEESVTGNAWLSEAPMRGDRVEILCENDFNGVQKRKGIIQKVLRVNT